MEQNEGLDFSTKPYEEWVQFLFGQELVQSSGRNPFEQYDLADFPTQPLVLIEHLTRLCQELPDQIKKYGWKQVDQGLWAALSYPFSISLYLLCDDTLPLEPRIECIRAMKSVFTDVVSKIPSEEVRDTFYWMWWDIICHDLQESSEIALCDAAFDILKQILDTKSEPCEICALHGLGHLHHPQVSSVVQSYIDQNRQKIDPEFMQWLERCRDGTVL